MALYFYEKYRTYTSTTYSDPGGWESASSITMDGLTVSNSYTFSSSEGFRRGSSFTIMAADRNYFGRSYASMGSIYYNGSGESLYENTITDPGGLFFTASRRLKRSTSSSETFKGSYIETITAEEGAYPDDGAQDGNWYIKTTLAGVSTLLAPNGGESWSKIHDITFELSESTLQTEIQLSTDAGLNWSTIVSLTESGATSYTHDFSDVSVSDQCLIRIRPYDGQTYGEFDESDEFFSIVEKEKVGEFRANGLTIPIYNPDVGMDEKNQLRVADKDGNVACFELVDTTDSISSPFRVSTSSGVKAIGTE